MNEQERLEQVMPGWVLREKIGEGAYGEVWRVVSRAEGAESALKIIRIPHDENERYTLYGTGMSREEITDYIEQEAARSLEEISAMQELADVPGVVRIEDYALLREEERITIYIRMELLESLPHWLYRQKKQEPDHEQTLRLGIQICDALDACERRGILHRDVKPSNIFIDAEGNFRLGDFGIARKLGDTSSATLSRRGTPRYMAPEVTGGHYGKEVNIYSLGLVLYQYFNHGRLPFEPAWPAPLRAVDAEAAAQRRFSGEKIPTPDEADQLTSQVLAMALDVDPRRRWRSAAAFRTALCTLQEKEQSVEREQVSESVENEKKRQEAGTVENTSQESGPGAVELVPEKSAKEEPADDAPVRENQVSPTPGKKSRRPLWIALAALALLVVIGVAVFGQGGGSSAGKSGNAAKKAESDIESTKEADDTVYTVHYEANGGEGTMDNEEITREDLSWYCLDPIDFTRDGYEFAGWSLDPEKSDIYMEDVADPPKNFLDQADEDGKITLYALWERTDFTLHFDANGGVGTIEDWKVQADDLDGLTVSRNDFYRQGYAFCGWSFERGEREKVVLPPEGQEGTATRKDYLRYAGEDGRISLYAVWSKVQGGDDCSFRMYMNPDDTWTEEDEKGEDHEESGTWVYTLIHNRSDAAAALNVHYSFLDASGEEIGTADDELPCVAANQTVPSVGSFKDIHADRVILSVSASEPDEYRKDLAISREVEGDKMTLRIWNNDPDSSTYYEDGIVTVMDFSDDIAYYTYFELPKINAGESTKITYRSNADAIDPGRVYYALY